MNGLKTYIAGIGAILTGLGVVATGVVDGDAQRILEGTLVALGGLAALGLGHKVEKLKNVLEKFRK